MLGFAALYINDVMLISVQSNCSSFSALFCWTYRLTDMTQVEDTPVHIDCTVLSVSDNTGFDT